MYLQIWDYIAGDERTGGGPLYRFTGGHFKLLGDNPYIGRKREELRPHLRSFSVGDYLIFYRVMKPGVVILHVLHGRRNLAAIFSR